MPYLTLLISCLTFLLESLCKLIKGEDIKITLKFQQSQVNIFSRPQCGRSTSCVFSSHLYASTLTMQNGLIFNVQQ